MFHKPWMPYKYDEFGDRGMSEATLRSLHQLVQAGHGRALNEFYGWYREIQGMDAETALKHLESKGESPDAIRFALCQFTNINFLWLSISPGGGEMPQALAKLIIRDFGSIAGFKREFRGLAARSLTPDWLWLVWRHSEGRLALMESDHLRTPMIDPTVLPLLCCTLAEHAYILDYGLNRDIYIQNWLDKMANYHYAYNRLGVR